MPETFDPAHAMGRVLGNLQSLEFSLRLFLYDLGGFNQPATGDAQAVVNFSDASVGTWLPMTPLTSYDTLSQLIAKVNAEFAARSFQERIDPTMTDLRDALTHGRVLSRWPQGPLRLVKSSKPQNNEVQVTVSVALTEDWFKVQVRRTLGEIEKVVRVSQALGNPGFPKE